ncbi:2-oxo-4-hydroxy-4-carboxy-5-ureidoimidazoline decarboxylase [Streptomyces sp. NPDC049577]|uniref:2-oxo-4-hydroxy-4-carboxy-5-ureidoimidazoline decarboxylase n=1 Tax=Streptomyces sp. NPDC049577 TaxID=3155153 RepID=UPI003420FA01
MSASSTPGLTRFNAAGEDDARAALHEVCASAAWGEEILAGRPYRDAESLLAAAEAATERLGPDDLAEAMAGHPPIGRPQPGDETSAREQRGMADASAALTAEMRELNLAYQEKFGHVFLICATGLTAGQLRDAIRHRIGEPPDRERTTARRELAKINRIRLARLLEQPGPVSVSTHVLDTGAGRPAPGIAVSLSVREKGGADWRPHAASATDADGRCVFPPLPRAEPGTRARLVFETTGHPSATGETFFPEVTVTFAVTPGEHYHVPLLLSPFGYSVYRGS